jgi:cardiolipin synthase (CMP-forming)
MDKRILTVPNQLTFLRMGFLPFFIIAIHYDRYDWALGILLIAALSDGFDGLLARRLNQRSPLGAYLDPIADKLLLSSSYFVLALKRKIAFWLAIIVLGRDVLILVACAAILLVVGYRPFPPSLIGKATTGFEILLVFLVILGSVMPRPGLQMVCGIGAYIVAFFAILSGLYYSVVVARRLSSE